MVHTPGEIAQQPETWQSTFELFQKKAREIQDFLASAGLAVDPRIRPTVFLVGAGTSDYIGHSLAYLFRKTWHCEVIAVPSTDLLTHMDELCDPEKRYLWISFSRSGDSPEGIAVLERALRSRPDIYHLVVSCHANGQMIRANAANPQVLSICLDDSVNDRGLAMTSSFSNMVVFGQCLADTANLSKYEQVLSRLIEGGKKLSAYRRGLRCVVSKTAIHQSLFCRFRTVASRRQRICPQTAGTDRRQDRNDVRVRSRPASWPHGRVGPQHSVRLFSFQQ